MIKTRFFHLKKTGRFMFRARILAGLCLLLPLPAPSQAPSGSALSGSGETADPSRLDVIEDLSESLANNLLDLSVATRDRDLERIAEHFANKLLAQPFPDQPQAPGLVIKWIYSRTWETGGSVAPTSVAKGDPFSLAALKEMSRSEFLAGFGGFLSHFSEIEDVRFKVKEANFDSIGLAGPQGSLCRARVAFYVIGRNREGKREWARGTSFVRARETGKEQWQMESFHLAALDSLLADCDLFSEVSIPAGLSFNLPSYGAPGSGGFAWNGAAAADFNGDGWMDLVVTAPERCFLYLNDGKGHFIDASEHTAIRLLPGGVAPLALDFDNDGDQDLFISNVGRQMLLENRFKQEGKLVFRDISLEAGVDIPAIGFSAVAGDVNGDGLPDIYVTCYNSYGRITPNSWFRATNGTPNLLFINQGNGVFKEEAKKWGVDDSRWSYAAVMVDLNQDGRLDLLLANDFGEKGLFINQGDRFEDEARQMGLLDPGNGMGVSVGDYNNDGLLDVHYTNMSSTAGNRILSRLFPTQGPQENVLKKLAAGNALYENLGNGHYRETTAEAGGFSAGWAWGGGFLDFDNDGWEDLFTTNGFISGKSMKDT
jgi:hypothetical protein